MRTYGTYKHSGIEWIGEIPEHWLVKRLKYVSSINPSNVDKKSSEDEKQVFLCNYVDVYKNDFITSDLQFMEATASDAQIENFILRKGDVLITKDSETPDDIAVPALVKEELDNVICGYHLSHVKCNDQFIIGEFLFRLFQVDLYRQYFSTLARGITRYGLTTSSFTEMPTILPPLSEQTAIVNYLNTDTTEIDQTIVNKEALTNLFEEEKKALINEAVTKGLNPKVSLKPSGIDWLGDIPEHWEVKKLFYLFDKISSGTTPKSDDESYYLEGTINWLNTGDLNNSVIRETSKKITQKAFDEHSALKVYPIGSIVIAMYGATIGKLGLLEIETTTNQACCVLSEIKNTNTLFVFNCLISGDNALINLSYGGGQPNISQDTLRSFKIPIPPVEEQTAIIQYIETETTIINEKINLTKQEIELLKEYRQALIFEAVTGKICVLDNALKGQGI